MRVLHFGSNYLPKCGGNVVRMTSMLENNSCGNELFIMTTAPRDTFDDELYYQNSGIRILRIRDLEEAKARLPEAVKQYNIDIVVTHTIPANLLACRRLPKNIVIMTEVHSLINSGKVKNFGKDLLHRFFLSRRTSYFFTLSQSAQQYICAHYGVKKDRIVFLPNGVETHLENTRSKGNPNYFTFGYIGTFYQWQGIGVICDNVKRILSINNHVRLLLVGGGENENLLREMSEQYKDRLIVTGLVPKEDVKRYADEIDVLIIPRPSTLETETAIPLKIFDSITYRKPVIMSDVAGLTEVLSDNEAFIYSKNDSDGLFHTCEKAYHNQEQLNEKYLQAVKKIASWPTWDEIHDRQNSVFHMVKK